MNLLTGNEKAISHRNRIQAELQGDQFYYSARSCINGHTAMRRTDNGVCIECEQEIYWKSPACKKQRFNERRRFRLWCKQVGAMPNIITWYSWLRDHGHETLDSKKQQRQFQQSWNTGNR